MPILISVIIPTYNSSKTIKKCLESILNQTFTNFEIIIIDGLSLDKTLKISKSFDDCRIIIHSEEDTGIYEAMNKGMKLARGEWCYFLGSDDLLYSENTLQEISRILTITQKQIVYGNVIIQGDAGWANDQTIYDGKFDLKKILKKNICHQAIFYKSHLLRKHSYNDKFHICADYDLNLKLFSKYEFQYAELIIAIFNGGGKSLISEDIYFPHVESVIKYFYRNLFKAEFYSIKNPIRQEAINTSNILKKIYLNAVYLKHRYNGTSS